MEQPIKKNKFSYFADLTFGFVHKRFGNEITDQIENLTIKTEMLMKEKLPDQV